ncbi:MAG TPA: RecX family transcriptional regulator [Polyangiaceae bacterium]
MARGKPARDEPLEPRDLEAAALRYLNRFDCSVQKLRRHLSLLIRRRGGDALALGDALEALLARYQQNGLLNDARFAQNLGERLQERGASRRLILAKLRARGISNADAESSVPRSREAELAAARALVRKKRLGPYRAEEERQSLRRRDLATLARAGFDHEVAIRALGHGTEDDF